MSTQIRHFLNLKKKQGTYILLIKERKTNCEESAFFTLKKKKKILALKLEHSQPKTMKALLLRPVTSPQL